MHGIEKWNYEMHGFYNAVMLIEGAAALLNLKTALTLFFKKKLKQGGIH